MAKHRIVIKRSAWILIGIVLYCSMIPNLVSAARNNPAIVTDLNDKPFNMENMVPGDSIVRTATIKNDGQQSFTYYFFINKIHSKKNLYENLFVQLQSDSEILYEGQLKNNHQFKKLLLSKGDSGSLQITVKMPEELGNEFQGSEAVVKLGFMAETELVGSNLHDTGTSDRGSGGIPMSNHVSNHYETLLIGIFFTITGGGLLSLRYHKKGD